MRIFHIQNKELYQETVDKFCSNNNMNIVKKSYGINNKINLLEQTFSVSFMNQYYFIFSSSENKLDYIFIVGYKAHKAVTGYMDWNGITGNVNFRNFTTNATNPGGFADFHMIIEVMNPLFYGVCYLYDSNHPYNPPYQIAPIFNPEEVSPSFYTRANIALNTHIGPHLLDRVIIHEFGHGLGLAHLKCSDRSIMHGDLFSISSQIQDHDRHNLRLIYN